MRGALEPRTDQADEEAEEMRKMDKVEKFIVVWTIVNASLIVFGVAGYIAIHFDAWVSGIDADDWFGISMLFGSFSFIAEAIMVLFIPFEDY